jgi:hypothetical protein
MEMRAMKPRFAIRGLLAAAIGGAMLGAVAQPAAAIEFTQHPSDSPEVNAILLKGRIDDGDTFELQVYIANLPKKPTLVVYLDSPGGNLREGMRLGRFFHQAKIETVVEAKTRCTSACALAFLGGRDNVTGKLKRTKSTTGAVGFHSFSREFDKDRSYTAQDLAYVLQRTQTEIFGVAEYLRAIGSDPDVLRVMLRAPANDMNFISNDDAIALGILVWDEKRNKLIEPEIVLNGLDRSRSGASATPTAATPSPAATSPAPVVFRVQAAS